MLSRFAPDDLDEEPGATIVLRGTAQETAQSGRDVGIDWSRFDMSDVRAYPAGRLRGLQVADAVAGAFYNAVEATKTSGQRPAYAEILLPRLYKSRGKAWGNGLKIVPREAVDVVDRDEALAWCKAVKENR